MTPLTLTEQLREVLLDTDASGGPFLMQGLQANSWVSAKKKGEALAYHFLAFEVWTPLCHHFLLLQKRAKTRENGREVRQT